MNETFSLEEHDVIVAGGPMTTLSDMVDEIAETCPDHYELLTGLAFVQSPKRALLLTGDEAAVQAVKRLIPMECALESENPSASVNLLVLDASAETIWADWVMHEPTLADKALICIIGDVPAFWDALEHERVQWGGVGVVRFRRGE